MKARTHFVFISRAILLSTILIAPSLYGANLVQDPGFESVATPGTTCAGDGIAWVVGRGDVDITSDDGFHWMAAEGTNSVDLSGSVGCSSTLNGSIYQDLSTTPGTIYRLRFALAGNWGDAPSIKDLQVFWGDRALPDLFFDTTGKSGTNMGWTYYEFLLPATNATTRLTFQTPMTTGYGPVIDDVSVEPWQTVLSVHCSAPDCSQVDLCWGSVSNAQYQLQYRYDFATNVWTDFGSPISGNGTTNCYTDPVVAGQPKKFYRVRLIP